MPNQHLAIQQFPERADVVRPSGAGGAEEGLHHPPSLTALLILFLAKIGCVPPPYPCYLPGFQSTRVMGDPVVGRHLRKRLGHGGQGQEEQETGHPENWSWSHGTDSEGPHPSPGLGQATAWGGDLTSGSERSCGPCGVPGQCKRAVHGRAEELSPPSSHRPFFGFAQDSELTHKNAGILPEGSLYLVEFPAG